MMSKTTLLIVCAGAALFSTAEAADLLNRDVGDRNYGSLKDDPGPAPTFLWSGFYIGANAGYTRGGKGDRADVTFAALGVNAGSIGEVESKGAFGGLQAGYNWQWGRWVVGVEGDLQGAGIDDDITGVADDVAGFPFAANVSTETSFFGTIRARLGYSWERTLLYITGGLAFADTDYKLSAFNPTFGSVTLSDSDTREGYVVGAGLEYLLTPNWTIKVEYQYLDFSDNALFNQSSLGGVPTGVVFKTESELDLHTARVGVNRKF